MEKLLHRTFQNEDFESILNEKLNLIKVISIGFKEKRPAICYEINDLIHEGVLVLFECIKLYKNKKEKFNDFLTISLRNHFINITRKERAKKEIEESKEKITTKRPIFLNGLSRKAKLFISVALEIPEGLMSWMSDKPCIAYPYCIGYYLNMNRKEIKKIKTELEEKLLGY